MAEETRTANNNLVAVGVGVLVIVALLIGLGLGVVVAVKISHLDQQPVAGCQWVSLDREFELGLRPGGEVVWRPREGVRPRPRPGSGDANPAGMVGAEEPEK